LDVEHFGDRTLVILEATGRELMDHHTLEVLNEQLLHLADDTSDRGDMVLDLRRVEFLDSAALWKFVTLHRKLQSANRRLILWNVRPALSDILKVSHLDTLFRVDVHSAERTARDAADSAPPHDASDAPTRKGFLVLLCDSQPNRAAKIVNDLSVEMDIVHLSHPDLFASFLKKHAPAAIALPLQWHASSNGKDPDALTLDFLAAHSRRLPVVVYAPTEKLNLERYCRVLAAGAKRILNEEAATFTSDLRLYMSHLAAGFRARDEEHEQLVDTFAARGLIGGSPALLEVFRRAVKAARFSDLPVLILGETGTGKQRLAEAIHALDPQRHQEPFFSLNCSAINKTLAESELFGHIKGAFSGAQSDRPGLFRMANGGTLLLDEVGELDLELQPKLLRVLQEHRLLPVGADYEHSVDLRIIAATNRPLETMIAEGKFREDLYQRLNVFRIHIPPLRERPEDIEFQARHFLNSYQAGRVHRVTDFGLRVLEALRLLPWEGNTRQLENLMRETLAHKDQGTLLQMEDLPPWVLEKLARLRPNAPQVDSREENIQRALDLKLSMSEAVDQFEKRLLQVVLERNRGNRTRTAAELGLTARSIFNKIKKYRLES
jgi:anti-anti-sigma factor